MATTKYSSVKFVSISALITVIFCIAIACNISPFLRGPAPYPPEWQWSYEFTNTLSRIWAPIGAGMIGIIGFLYFDYKNRIQKNTSLYFLSFLVIFSLVLEASILFFSRAGIGVLLERIISPGINGYFTTALNINDIGKFFTTFEASVSHFPMRAADHPPLAVIFFSVFLFVSTHLQYIYPYIGKLSLHHGDIALIWNHLQLSQKTAALLSAISIPLLSTFTLVPLFYFTKLNYDQKSAVRACFLYALVPSLSLFLPLSDVFLGLFSVGGFLLVKRGENRNNIYYFLAGLIFSIGVFFSVSLIVPVVMALMYLLLSHEVASSKLVKICMLLLGLSCIPLLLFIFFHFNTIGVFIKITSLQAKRSYVPWIFYNLYDFFIFAGIPVLIASILLIRNQLRKSVQKDALAVSFFVILFLLDVSGFSRAEAGRIWMPYMPLLAAIVTGYLTRVRKVSTYVFAMLLILQFLQIVVMQEVWVTLW